MPNWCEGNIRVKGTYDKIVKFFSNNLIALKRDSKGDIEDLPVDIHKDSDFYTEIRKPDDSCEDEFWFKDSTRQFLKTDVVGLADWSDDPFQEIVICVDGFKGAWGIDLDDFKEMAIRSEVDIRIVGYDRGMQFMEVAEFLRDGRVTEKTTRFKDWMWECPCPNLGG